VSTAEYGPLQRAVAVRTICQKAHERDLLAAGAFGIDIASHTVANSLGLLAHHVSATAELMTVVMSEDSSGHTSHLSLDAEEIDAEAVADEAIEKALRGREPRSIESGEYEVVLEENAVSDMLDFLGFTGFGALSVQEGRSFMSGKLGSAVTGPNVSIRDDPLDPSGIPRSFDAEGIPARRVDLVVNGLARSPVYDRRTAVAGGATSTGHALPSEVTLGPLPRNMFLEPGQASKEDLVQSVKRGLLVTRFWYTRVVHPMTVHMTGMTRDGTFLIENGEIVASVRNLRFTESYLQALGRVGLIGKDTRLVRDFFSTNRVPALKIDGWNFNDSSQQ
jgi:predicted Zn-dependent protease